MTPQVHGGEEFLLVIPGCDPATTVRRANQIRELVLGKPISIPAGTRHVTLSMGATVAESSCAVPIDHCIRLSTEEETALKKPPLPRIR
jgi:PleD family two-component response regulator